MASDTPRSRSPSPRHAHALALPDAEDLVARVGFPIVTTPAAPAASPGEAGYEVERTLPDNLVLASFEERWAQWRLTFPNLEVNVSVFNDEITTCFEAQEHAEQAITQSYHDAIQHSLEMERSLNRMYRQCFKTMDTRQSLKWLLY